MLLDGWDVHDFVGILGMGFLSDGGYDVRLLESGCIGVAMGHICEYSGIELEEVFPKEEGE